MRIFRMLVFRKITNLRRFAAGNFVFDDPIAGVHVVGSECGALDHDAIPVGAGVTQFPAPADP
jgi:hypothetical protein